MIRSQPYELDYTTRDASDVDAELGVLLADPLLKADGGKLLKFLEDLTNRGADALKENVHLPSTTPPLHCVHIGKCAVFYAYGQRNGVAIIFLLGFYKRGVHLQSVGTAAARLVGVST